MSSNNIISKETIKRLIKDINTIIKSPLTDNGIFYKHDEEDMLKGYALIIGPENTPYFGGFYFFKIIFPMDYPHSPPKVSYCTNDEGIRFNPNLYICGKVCISLLNTWKGDQWTSCQTISTILLTLCSLLCENPLLNEPGINEKHRDIVNYNHIIEYSNINIAVCNIIQKKVGVFLEDFYFFYPIVTEYFMKVFEKHIQFIKKKRGLFKTPTRINTDFYRMGVVIDYEKFLEKIIKCKEDLILQIQNKN